jgi:type IV pilus assembly protein PilA
MEGKNIVSEQPNKDEPNHSHGKLGFSLVELLIIIVIIGLLAVIGIPQFISYRSRSIDAQLKSDLRNAAVAVESYFTKRSVLPSSIDEIQGFGFQPTDGVTLTLNVVTATSYTLSAAKPGGSQPSFTFTSNTGLIQ